MKYLLPLFFTLALLVQIEAQDAGIQFVHTDWAKTLEQAKAEDKIIFVDAFTDWCGPCKWMTANVFPDQAVGDYYNEHFINVKIDMEKGEGILFRKAYEVNAYPTLLFIDAKGNMVHKALGSRDAAKFIALGEAAVDPNRQIASLEAKYNEGNREPEFLKQYATGMSDAGIKGASAIATEYLATQKDWNSSDNMDFIFDMADWYNSEDPLYQQVANNRTTYQQHKGVSDVDNRLKMGPYMQLRKTQDASRAQIEAAYKVVFPKDYVQFADEHQMNALRRSKEEGAKEAFMQAAVNYMEKYKPADWMQLNSMAWTFYEMTDDPTMLLHAREWAKQSVALKSEYMNNDTLAAVCFKLKEKEAAMKHAKLAIELAKASGEDASETEALLGKIMAL